MAQKHLSLGQHAEAAQCTIHAAALVAEYLALVEVPTEGMPGGCAAFERLSSNCLEESAVSDDLASPDQEGICTHKMFQANGLVALLKTAAHQFKMAKMHESVNEVYKLLVPIFEQQRDFARLADVHSDLSRSFKDILAVTESGRYLGSYFRVGFYGDLFDADLRDKQFVYKEPTITQLSEFSLRLKDHFSNIFGAGNVELISDSKQVDAKALQPGRAFIQITYVNPHLEEFELKRRVTYFERNHDIRNFMFETPFTIDGKAHGGIDSQLVRKTYLTVEKSFPYLKTRLLVTNFREEILQPIEVAIENISKKALDLATMVNTKPVNLKLLQLQLQVRGGGGGGVQMQNLCVCIKSPPLTHSSIPIPTSIPSH